jgi:hypothetical protein
MTEAAAALGVTNHRVRQLIKAGILSAEQVVAGAPWQIRAEDRLRRRCKPRWPGKVARVAAPTRTRFQCVQILERELYNDTGLAIPRRAPFGGIVGQAHTPVVEKQRGSLMRMRRRMRRRRQPA